MVAKFPYEYKCRNHGTRPTKEPELLYNTARMEWSPDFMLFFPVHLICPFVWPWGAYIFGLALFLGVSLGAFLDVAWHLNLCSRWRRLSSQSGVWAWSHQLRGGRVDVTPRMWVDLVLSVGAGEKQTKFGWAWSNQLKGNVAPRVWAGLISSVEGGSLFQSVGGPGLIS